MPTIDADAHVIESERTWDYVENPKYKPQLTMPNGGGPQHWIIDGRAFRRGVNVDPTLSEADREMRYRRPLETHGRARDRYSGSLSVAFS